MINQTKRQSFRVIVGLTCLAITPCATSHAQNHVWQSSSPRGSGQVQPNTARGSTTQSRTIGLPQTQARQQNTVVPSQWTSSVTGADSFELAPEPVIDFGMPQALNTAAFPSDPLPSSPWKENRNVTPQPPRTASPSFDQPSTQPINRANTAPANVPRSFIQQPDVANSSTGFQVQATLTSASMRANNAEQPAWDQVRATGVPVATPEISRDETSTRPSLQQTPPSQQASQAPRSSTEPKNISLASQVGSTVPTKLAGTAAASDSRVLLAKKISRDLMYEPKKQQAVVPQAIETPLGWSAVREQLLRNLEECDQLLRRGAVQSAREEALVGARALLRSLDTHSGDWYSEPAFNRAMLAFVEEKDFHVVRSSTTRSESSPIAGHQTPVLHGADLRNISPVIAAQHYRAYARSQLVAASQGHPWAAELFYALGKTYDAEAEQGLPTSAMLREQAVCCYQAALDIQSNHGDAANQLGYSLIKLDRTQEAEQVLIAAVSRSPKPDMYKNLAELYRRRGDQARSSQATQQAIALESQSPTPAASKATPDVLQLTPEQFAQFSPNLTRPMTQTASNYTPARPAEVLQASGSDQAGNVVSSAAAAAKPSFFQRIFR